MNAPYPTEDAFREASQAFLETYASFTPELDKQRIYLGWKWREHRTKYTSLGYLEKRSTFALPISAPSSSSDTTKESGPAVEGERRQGGIGRVGKEGVREEEGLEDEEEDESTLRPSDRTQLVNVEFTVFRSATYLVPQLYIRAWDASGAPISLSQLLPLLSLTSATGSDTASPHDTTARDPDTATAPHPDVATPPPPDAATPQPPDAAGLPTRSALTITDDSVFLPAETERSAEFPLLQFTEHPTSGLGCWSVHPCHVAEAVSELVAESGRGWLETWFMLSGNVVDLR